MYIVLLLPVYDLNMFFLIVYFLIVRVAVSMQMVAEGRPTKRWWSQWLRWRRGFHQKNAVAAKQAQWRPYIMHFAVSNKCKVDNWKHFLLL